MTTLIIPAAGKSSRFPDMRPKWLLTHPKGLPMFVEGVSGLDLKNVFKAYLVVLKSHLNENHVQVDRLVEMFYETFPNWTGIFKVLVLEQETQNQPETIVQAIKLSNIYGPIFIKDSDNYFECCPKDENQVSVYDLSSMDLIYAKNKSFIVSDENGVISNIVEKQIISSEFCVGGYSFKDAEDFTNTFLSLKNDENLYVSHIIFKMLLDNKIFIKDIVKNYQDFGTLEEWKRVLKQYKTLFVDIDGVLLKNTGEYCGIEILSSKAIQANIDIINELYDGGKTKIFLTTARSSKHSLATHEELYYYGVKFHNIMFDLFHSKRIIINDYANTNQYPSCEAVNLERDSDQLRKMLEGI